MNKHLLVLLACLFIVMIGFGITLPVLPFYVERLALAEGATRQSVVIHVGLLTGVYALMQLIFARMSPLKKRARNSTSMARRACRLWTRRAVAAAQSAFTVLRGRKYPTKASRKLMN